jgi:hypothetical protein
MKGDKMPELGLHCLTFGSRGTCTHWRGLGVWIPEPAWDIVCIENRSSWTCPVMDTLRHLLYILFCFIYVNSAVYFSQKWIITCKILGSLKGSCEGECKIEVFTAVTMKNVVFWDTKTQFVLHRRHVSATESSQLMLCKIWGFHGSNYEECRFLGYKNPVRTSQETRFRYRVQPVTGM